VAIKQSIQMTPPKFPVSGPGIGGRSIKVERAEYNAATQGAVAAGDTVQLFKLHPGFRVTSGFVQVKNGGLGAGVTATVGDTAVPDRYFASSSLAAVGTTTAIAETGRDYLTPRAYTIVNLNVAGATTNTTGSVVVEIHGYIEEPA